MTSWEFPASDPIDLQVRIPAGRITVTTVHDQTATVTLSPDDPGGRGDELVAATRVEFDQGTLSVNAPERHRGLGGDFSLDAVLELPEGSSCLVDTASADVSCRGKFSAAEIHTASGDVSVEQVTGPARITTASGDVQVGAVAELLANTASGRVGAARVSGEISVRTASGDVRIDEASGARTDIKATSGDISVGVIPGIGIYLDISTLSGTVRSELESSDETDSTDMALICRTISGDVQITRAARTMSAIKE
jgi:hypothetical protein